MEDAAKILIALINSMAVMSVVAYIITRSSFYNDILEGKIGWKNQILLMVVFGIFSIYGTLSGFEIRGAIANTRDLGPTLGGLIAGPLVGIGAGLIGAVHRYSLGGFTQLSCSVATVTAGLIGGLVYLFMRRRFVGVIGSVFVAVLVEVVHGLWALALARPFEQALAVFNNFVPLMIVANGVGMGIYASIVVNLVKQRDWESAKHAIEGELTAAREIQMSIVPKIFPPFPDNPEFQLHAALEPAKEVGGDFYDFFFTDPRHLVALIGDVSGKGVPASLFMAVTKTLLKSKATPGAGPDEILMKVNKELCPGNDSSMFATVFCAVLDIESGAVEYSSAGHNHPLVLYKDQIPRYLDYPGSMALGVFENTVYSKGGFSLRPDETLILYTDGVTEAMNRKGQFFAEERLTHSVYGAGAETAEEILKRVLAGVKGFAAGAPQSDDITLLALKFKGIEFKRGSIALGG